MEDNQNNNVFNNNEQEQNIEQEVNWEEKYLYLAADLQNVKKRHNQQLTNALKYANEDICRDLLTIIDNVRLDYKHTTSVQDKERYQAIIDSLHTLLNKYDVYEMYESARPGVFAQDTDNAVTSLPTDDQMMDNAIVDVIKSGYSYKDKVLRYEDVIIYKYND